MIRIMIFILILFSFTFSDAIRHDIVAKMPEPTSFMVTLHRDRTQDHLYSLVDMVKKRHIDEDIDHFSANVTAVMRHFLMFDIEHPSEGALKELRSHPHVMLVLKNTILTIDSVAESEELAPPPPRYGLRGSINDTDPVASRHMFEMLNKVELLGPDPEIGPDGKPKTIHLDSNGKVKTSNFCNQIRYNWGLDAIDQESTNLDCKNYEYAEFSRGGLGVEIYVLDTGLRTTHVEFNGARKVINYKFGLSGLNTGNAIDNDLNGHGTHVAGIAGGLNTGVAPNADIFAIKVLNDEGGGISSWAIAGLNEVAERRVKRPHKRMVVNMSLSGDFASNINTAVADLARMGVPVVVSAGNDASNSCNYSPAAAWATITSAASDQNFEFSDFSNFGQCVRVIAPGVQITSACAYSGLGCTTDKTDIYSRSSGTSQASPFVAGTMALDLFHLRSIDYTPLPGLSHNYINCAALDDKVSNVPDVNANNLTPNKFLHLPGIPLTYYEKKCLGLPYPGNGA